MAQDLQSLEIRRQRRIQIALGEKKQKMKTQTIVTKTFYSNDDTFSIEFEQVENKNLKRKDLELMPSSSTYKNGTTITLRHRDMSKGIELPEKKTYPN